MMNCHDRLHDIFYLTYPQRLWHYFMMLDQLVLVKLPSVNIF